MEEQREWFLEMNYTPAKLALQIVEMTKKSLEYYVDIVYKALAWFEKMDSNFQRGLTVGKTLSNSIKFYREVICKRNSIDAANLIVFLF